MNDLIKRSDAIEAVADYFDYSRRFAKSILDKVPSADRPQGEWKRRLVDNGFNADWVCSECGYRVKTDFVSFNYCPNCGARMKGADDE
jgi:rubrerythrin